MARPFAHILAAFALVFVPAGIAAHPHVFAEARLDVTVGPGETVESLQHLWRFDELFSSTVVLEFDKDGDLKLDEAELQTVADTVLESIAEFDFFQSVTRDGAAVDMAAPEKMIIDFEDNQMIILFESRPREPLPLSGKLAFGVYDPTFYTAIEYVEDVHMAAAPLPEYCKPAVVRPDPDEAIAQNQDTLTEAFYNEPDGNDLSKIFATRLELDCGERTQ